MSKKTALNRRSLLGVLSAAPRTPRHGRGLGSCALPRLHWLRRRLADISVSGDEEVRALADISDQESDEVISSLGAPAGGKLRLGDKGRLRDLVT